MTNILKKIFDNKVIEIEETKNRCSYKTLEKLISPKLEKREFKEKLISFAKHTLNQISTTSSI